MRSAIAILAILVLLLVLSWGRLTAVDPAAGIPVEVLAAVRDRPQPQIGLMGPLPAWIPLPAHGQVTRAGLSAPQPPYGASATLMLLIDEGAEAFAADYRARLELAGYRVRDIPPGFNVAFDEPDLQLQAEGPEGHVVYVSLRHTRAARFAQLTCWEPPAPRL
jgi:hypothetical protein